MKSRAHPLTRFQRLRATPVAAAVATLLCAVPGAQAQQADAAAQTVTVTGIRRGIESAINVKKNADGVVEAISAEDIGKLPDTSIAESIARLPGVTTQRTRSGGASTINIRGLGPDFNGYLLNGREQTSVGDSRAVDLSVYPAELIGGVTIYKTTDAGLMSAGLAGTIDNRLIDPLAFGGRVVAGNYQDITTGKGLPVEGSGKRYSLTYIDQFADRKVGLAIGFVRADGTTNELGAGGWGDGTYTANLAGGGTQANVKVPTFGGGLDNYKTRRVTDERTGVAAIVAFKPNKDLSSQLDLYFGKIDSQIKEARMQGGLGGPLNNATVVNGVAVKGTLQLATGPNGLINRIESIFDKDEIKSAGWRTNWKFMPGWEGSVDLSHNTAKRVERDIEAYSGVTTGADTLSFDTTGGGPPQFTLGRPLEYTNPATIKVRDQTGWSGRSDLAQAGYAKGPTIVDKASALRFDLRKEMPQGGWFTDLQFGGNYTKRTKDRTSVDGVINGSGANPAAPFNFPASAYVEKNVGGTGVDLLTFDPTEALWDGARIEPKYNDDILSKTWRVKEAVTTAYLKANLDTELAGLPLRGNLGLQVVNTDQSSAGYRAGIGADVVLVNPAKQLSTAGTKYTDLLPSLNLTGDLGGGQYIRLGLAQQIARPTLTDMRNSFAASVENDKSKATYNMFTGSAGNPLLKPFKAKALDISYEKYFGGNKGYVGVAGFYKQLDTYITTQTTLNYDFTTYAKELNIDIPGPKADANGVVKPGGPNGIFTQAVNGKGGNLNGVELTASVPFNLVYKSFDGFGMAASYAYTESSVNLPNLIGLNPNQQVPVSGKMPLPGLSRINSKLMLYYEAKGFSAFVAHNQRSDYVGSVANDATGGYPTLKIIEGSEWLSAQIGYEFQEGQFKGLGFRVEGNNLNKPVYRQLRLDRSVETENRTGASVAFKLSYKLQ